MKKRILSLLLALCLAFSLAPAVYGEDGGETPDFYCRIFYADGLSEDRQTDLYGEIADTREVLFFSAENGETAMEFSSVAFRPAEGTASDAVTTVPAQDGAWAISFAHVGSGTLVCTMAEEKEYTLPVIIGLPFCAFYTAPIRDEAHLAVNEITLDAGDSLWLIRGTGILQEMAEAIRWRCETKDYSSLDPEEYLQTELVEYTLPEGVTPIEEGPFYAVKVTLEKIFGSQMRITAYNGLYASCTVINKNPPQLTKLAAPTELTWSTVTPGEMTFHAERPTQNRYDWELFRTDLDEPIMHVEFSFSALADDDYRTLGHFIWGNVPNERLTAEDCDMESGTYYFTLRSLGDDQTYSDSETVVSPEWTYTKPDTRLDQVTNLRWEGRTACWDAPAGTEGKAVTYSVEFYRRQEYWSGSPDNITVYWDDIGGFMNQSETSAQLTDRILSYGGAGIYAFRVQAISWDISEVYNSLWTDQSETISVTATVDQVNDQLEDLANQYTKEEPLTAEEKAELKATLADVGDALEQAMAADQGEDDGTVAKVAALEEFVGGPAGVTVSDGMSSRFDSTKVSIVGANLNTEGTTTATLQISEADSGTVIPEQYKNTLQFSMKLENVEPGADGHQQLSVPVRITLPVPANIDPAFLVILHAKAGGGYEEIVFPRIFVENGVTYVSFVVTSFSDFALAEAYGAQLTADGQLTVNAPTGAVHALAAVYDADGQLISTAMATIPETGPFLLTPALAGGDHAKVFFLDASLAPVVPAANVPLN